MKKFFIRIIRPSVKGLHRMIKTSKKIYKKATREYHRARHVHGAVSVNNGDVKRTRHRSRPKIILKDKRFIVTACAAAIVIAVVLSIVLPKPDAAAETTVMAFAPASDINLTSPEPSVTYKDFSTVQPITTVQPIATEMSIPEDVQSNSAEDESASEDELASEPLLLESASVPTTPPEAKTVPTTAPDTPDTPDLVPGCSDPRILDVQERLMELGYMGEDEPTDHYDYGTEYALQLFQRKHSLQVDGLLGEQTESALFSKDAKPYTVKLGDKGTDVEGIQERLQELKYMKAGSTGYFGTDTETAVKSFQKRNGLSADGNVGDNTLEILYSEDAKPAKTSSGGSSGGSSGSSGGSVGSSGGSGGSSGGTGGSSGSDVSEPPPGDPDDASADALIEFAKTQLGKKYVRGGKGPNVFDCSGFVYYSLNQVGYKIKYMTSAGWAKSSLPKVSKMSDLQKGDIICFKGHVGIYMGDAKMIDASSSQGKIRICSNIFDSSYWTRNFICGRRVF